MRGYVKHVSFGYGTKYVLAHSILKDRQVKVWFEVCALEFEGALPLFVGSFSFELVKW